MIAIVLQNRYERPNGEGPQWDNCYTHGMLKPIIEAMGGESAYQRIQADSRIYDRPTSEFAVEADRTVAEIRALNPSYILACGRAAHEAIANLDGYPILRIPHPAWRGFSRDMQASVALAVRARRVGWLFVGRRDNGDRDCS